MEQKMQFRSAGFGGFNRQDVLNYIEETAKESNQKWEELCTQYEAAQEEMDALNRALSLSREREETLQDQLDELTKEKENLLARVKKLEPLQAQVTLLHSRVELLTPDAEAYAGLKNQISEIELEARQRAAAILEQARNEAAELTETAQTQAEALRAETERDVAQLRQETETAVEEQLQQARIQAEDILAQANQTAQDAIAEANQQVAAEQARAQDLQSKTQAAFAETGAVVRSIVANSVAEIQRIQEALLSLKNTYSKTQEELEAQEPEESNDE